MMNNNDIRVTTPEILWHGGGLLPGKPDPVLSIDMYSEDILVTSGIDANIPPKGSIRLWKYGSNDNELHFLLDLSDHQDVVNVVRFSPCGRMIASASLGLIIVYSVSNPLMWRSIDDPKMVERIWLRPCLQEIYDLNWSPDGQFIIAGSIDSKGEILRVKDRNALGLRGHTSYVQGVVWDPMNQMVVTQSADRSCRIHQLKHRDGSMVKLATKGHSVIKMMGSISTNNNSAEGPENKSDAPSTPPREEDTPSGRISPTNQTATILKGINLYADSSVATCFFRRLAFSPDGALLVTPTGICKSSKGAPASSHFATHIFLRDHHIGDLSTPIVSLVGLESPSVAVRFSPLLYQMIPSKTAPLFSGDYRMIFAVVTTTAVLIYDTQHQYPLARINGCHLATINDVAWSSNGQTLVFCSSDGYVTFARLNQGILGCPIPSDKVPMEVKNAFASVYLPPQIDLPNPIPTNTTPSSESSDIIKEAPKRAREDSTTTPVITDPAGVVQQQSKKKRITPILSTAPITPSNPILIGSVVDLTSGDSNPGRVSKEVEESKLLTPQPEKKVKKRITPTSGSIPPPNPLISEIIISSPTVDL